MKRRKYFVYSLIFLFFSILLLSYVLYGQENLPYLNPDLPVKERVKDLLSRMTIEEKIAQLQCMLRGEEVIQERGIGGLGVVLRRLGPVEAAKKANKIQRYAYEHTRLKIPVIIHDEALHGLVGKGATSFPQAIGLASTWDTQLMEKVATVIARETKSRGIHQVLSPVINIARDVRWGRVEESYGEDPYLTSRMGVAFCKSIEKEGVITTPKHFVANVGDGGRDSNPIHFSERLLREIYFPAFKACFQEAGARSVMAAYNSIDGLPCSANRWLLTDILRNEWGFKGFVVSDYGSVWGIVFKHNTASTKKEGAKQAIEAGLDVELPNINLYGEPLLQSVKSGLVSESTIDKSVKRILEIKFRMGLFENRYVDPDYAGKINDCKKHRKLALQAAREAIVLLKNEGNTLPLKKDIKSIAVIGPNADAVRLGGYSGSGMKVVTVLEGIKNKVSPGTRVFYEKGCELGKAALPPISSENLISTGEKGMVHGLKGEYFNNMDLSGDPVVVRIDKQVNFDWGGDSPDPKINSDHFSVRWSGKFTVPSTKLYRISITTDDGVRLYVNGRLLVDRWFDRAATTDIVSLKLEAGKQYDICIEYYENGGMAFASLGWDEKSDIEDEIQKAVEVVKKSDAVVVVTGIIEGEGRDRAYLDLPGSQEELIKKVSDVGKPVVVVLINGSAVTMNNWIDRVSAIVEAWYPGEEGGNAIADVLFCDYNPGGKLPITFPQSVGQAPLYYNYKPTGRGYDYIYVSGKPLFPFGYGLSYTEFKYSNLRITPEKITTNEKINISVDVENVGNFRGDEVVQLYLHDVVASMIRPVKELKGFKRITLDPEEKKTVNFVIKPEQLSFLDVNMNRIIEPGIFEVMIGSSSEDIRLKSSFEVVSR